jgi:hypothetical protein
MSLTIPTVFTDSISSSIELNIAPANGWLIQFNLQAPATSGNPWQENFQILGPGYPGCGYNLITAYPGNSWFLEIRYLGSPQNSWTLTDPKRSYWLNTYCSGLPSSTTFYSQNQEFFAFESYDPTYTDFTSLFMDAPTLMQYSPNGATWYNTPGAYVVNANNAGSWGSWVIGSNYPTPSQVVEAGHLQCSALKTYELNLGYWWNVCSSGTNTFGTQLMT